MAENGPLVFCFSQLSFDSEVYTKSAKAVYTSKTNESCEKQNTKGPFSAMFFLRK